MYNRHVVGELGYIPDLTQWEGLWSCSLGPCVPASCYEKNKLEFHPLSTGLFVPCIRIHWCHLQP